MRLGVLADIHGNLPALERVLDALAHERVDCYLCAGDLVGYGALPNECIERIASLGTLCVAGNHDLIALGELPSRGAGRLARETLLWTREELTAGSTGYLAALPRLVQTGTVVVTHGSLADPAAYVTAERASAQLRQLGETQPRSELLVLGHTHRPLAYGERRGTLLSGRAGTVKLEEGERHILNPGSVGQSRERRVVARFLVLDLEGRRAIFREAAYDHRAWRRVLRHRGLPPRTYHRNPKGLRARGGRVRRRLARAVRR